MAVVKWLGDDRGRVSSCESGRVGHLARNRGEVVILAGS